MIDVQPFSLTELMAPAIVIFVFGFALALYATRMLLWSLFAAVLKSSIFIIYYAVFFDGTFTFVDDWNYLENGKILLSQGMSTVNMFSHLPELCAQIGGRHVVYYLVNADSFRLFGSYYYAPVALNIILTFFAAAFTSAAVQRGVGVSKRLAAGLFVFMVLHPDVVAWSTVMNGKDILVLTGTVLVVYVVSLSESRQYLWPILLASFVGLLLFFTRFYVPLMLLGALFGALALSPAGRQSPLLWVLVVAGLGIVFSVLGWNGLLSAYERFHAEFVNPLYGVPRIALTPIPFHTVEQYAFLNLVQVFHWAMMPILVYGVYRVWRRATLTARFMVIYFLLMLLLYGMFDTLQGGRQRVQLDGLIAIFQFLGAIGILVQILGWRKLKPFLSSALPVVKGQ